MDIRKENDGNVSIESMLVLPIIILIYITFLQLISFYKLSDLKTHEIVNKMLEEQIKNYEKYKLEEQSIENQKINEKSNIENKYTIQLELKFLSKLFGYDEIKFVEEKTIRMFKNGDSLKEYNLSSNMIKTDENIWNLSNIKRAQAISKVLGGTVNFNGNSIDKIENNGVVSIVSLDTRKDSYLEENKILNKLKYDIDKLEKFKEGEVDGNWVKINDYNNKIFHLIIPNVNIEEKLKLELLRVRNYCKNKNVEFKISTLTGG